MIGMILRRSSLLLALSALLVLAAGPAGAFIPASQNDSYEIPLPAFDLFGHDGYDRDIGGIQAEHALAARYGGNWRVHSWNPQTGTPHFVYGTAPRLSASIADASALESLARQVIAGNAEVLGADLQNLRLTDTPHALGKWAVHYQQTYHGLDVWQSTVRLVFSDDGKLMLMGSDYYRDIDVNPVPAIGAEAAAGIAQSDLPFNSLTDRVEGAAELLVLPYPVSETEVEHHLVWRIRVRTEDPLGAWMTHVDAHDGTILWRYNDIHFAYGGDTESDVHHWVYCDGPPELQAVPYLNIDVSGIGTATSDENGDWTIAGSGGNRTVSCDMEGPYCHVYDNVQYPEAEFSGTAQEDVPLTVDWDDTNSHQDERDVMAGVSETHDFIRQFDAGFAYINQQIGAQVSINASCNAYWDGNIHFYREAGGCANTGEMHQVVHHEFGHGVQDHILGWQGDQGLGEGNSDILGNLITQDSVIGRGFYLGNCASGIRDADNNLVYPDDVIGQGIHYAGQVIAGFNWDAMILLQDLYGGGMNWDGLGTVMSGERWHYGRVLMHPTTQPDQVLATFIADDDDGDLGNGTPHHEIFCEAATNHGFDCPEILVGVFVYHDTHPYSGDMAFGYEIAGTAVSLGGGVIMPGTVNLHYRINGGGLTALAMSATGNPDEYAATIPAQAYGSVVEYYIYAENDLGDSGTSPTGAPAELHYFQVNDTFPDEMESDATSWVGEAFGDNASSGRWERADPQGTEYGGNVVQPEDDHTPIPGTDCWVTGAQAGSGAGTYDVDNGKTTLLSPRFDLEGVDAVTVSYWRWYTNDLGNNPGADWWDVDVTNDDGASWTAIEHTQTSSNAWQQVSINLLDYVATPGVVQFRFVAEDASPGSLVEALVDDFVLTADFGDLTDADHPIQVRVTHLMQNSPNPFNPKTEIRFNLEEAGETSLRIYDASGHLVKVLAQGNLTQGEHRVVWNGDDDGGSAVASGVYFYRLETATQSFSKRMVLLK